MTTPITPQGSRTDAKDWERPVRQDRRQPREEPPRDKRDDRRRDDDATTPENELETP